MNVTNDELRRRRRASRLHAALPAATAPPITDDEVARVETRALVHDLVARLSADHRAVIALRFGEDRPVADVARILGRSPAAVKQLQRRAIAELRSFLAGGADDV